MAAATLAVACGCAGSERQSTSPRSSSARPHAASSTPAQPTENPGPQPTPATDGGSPANERADQLARHFRYPPGTTVRRIVWAPRRWSIHPTPRLALVILRRCEGASCQDFVAIMSSGARRATALLRVPQFTSELGLIESAEFLPSSGEPDRAIYRVRSATAERSFVLCVWASWAGNAHEAKVFPADAGADPIDCRARFSK